ncbi:Crp/Fnr family transcriptional regulator [Aureibacter tunicatorum]|uniref:CRP-like cAMP-binding protein n=1 Tax=Aureibacter tunicatorum TaxID=866807 RepID=A0AAE4BUK1_9BACT|nr:Crp/Fnr family transcriptional regulator [Aureibacter tunicatorum]MDR6240852.1 CRP-like cAMP-binding protein [Aureibacter tunicatorum]BDD06814.1 cyclic nucleotide-binding protein [Aureibacter tunicatorum]
MQKLFQYIGSRCFIGAELREKIETDFTAAKYKKGDKLLSQDQISRKLYFIDKGVLHNYYYHDGKQISSWFYSEEHFVTGWYSFYSQSPSFEEIECLEDCVLYSISYDNYQKLIADSPAFGNFARLLAEESLAFIDYFSKGWSFLSAREKYDLLQTYFPNIENRVKLGLIASFLGISQETLSRIRSQK